MNNPKTYIFPLLMLLMLSFFACEKLEIPTKEEEQPKPSIIEEKDDVEDKDSTEAKDSTEEKDSIPIIPTDKDSLTFEDLSTYIDTHGTDEDNAYSVYDMLHLIPRYLEAFGADGMTSCYVTGYIVGYIPKNGRSMSQTIFGTGNVLTNIVIADSPDEKDYQNCLPIQLSTGSKGQQAVREGLNLSAHPENLGKCVILYGNIKKYMGTYGLKSVSDAILFTEE